MPTNPATDTVGLTQGGEQMWQLYNLYKSTAGWWNNNQTGVMTFEDWFGLMILYEIYYENKGTGSFVHAIGRQLYMVGNAYDGFHNYCPGEVCINGALNFLAAYSGSAMGQLSYLSDGIPETNYPGYYYNNTNGNTNTVMQQASAVGDLILHPQVYVKGFWRQRNLDMPYHFGNGSMWQQDSALMQVFNDLPSRVLLGPAALAWYKWGLWTTGNPNGAGAILTVNQMNNLQP